MSVRDYVVITPVRDEEAHLGALLEVMRAQTLRPRLWVIADDGSTDSTGAIARRAAAGEEWIAVADVSAPGGGPASARMAEGAVPRAFNRALASVRVPPHDVIVKLDADVTFGADYFERLLDRFAEDPALGIAGGRCYEPRGNGLRMEWTPDDHVRGATKAYRRECFRAIGGIEEVLGWDGIDQMRAHLAGWTSRTFDDLVLVHHRPNGSRGGVLRGRVRGGRCNYFLGYTPLFMLVRSVRRMADRPYVIGGLALLWGYVLSFLQRRERYADAEVRRYLRETQYRRLAAPVQRILGFGR